MPTWSVLRDLDAGDLVLASDMDQMRENINYLMEAYIVYDQQLAAVTTTSTSPVATGLAGTLVTQGGVVRAVMNGYQYNYSGVSASFRLTNNGTAVMNMPQTTYPVGGGFGMNYVADLTAGTYVFSVDYWSSTGVAIYMAHGALSLTED